MIEYLLKYFFIVGHSELLSESSWSWRLDRESLLASIASYSYDKWRWLKEWTNVWIIWGPPLPSLSLSPPICANGVELHSYTAMNSVSLTMRSLINYFGEHQFIDRHNWKNSTFHSVSKSTNNDLCLDFQFHLWQKRSEERFGAKTRLSARAFTPHAWQTSHHIWRTIS